MIIRPFLRVFCCLLVLTLFTACTTIEVETTPTTEMRALTPFSTRTPSLTPALELDQLEEVIFTPTPTQVIYSVKKDELGSAIALRYGISLQSLQSSNPDVDLNFLKEDQQLVIPPRQETPIPDLSSPTPAALIIKDLECYPAADQAGWCIATIQNNQQDGVMYITGEFILEGQHNTYQKPFTTLIDSLPPGKQIPVYALFDAPFPYPHKVNLLIQTALRQAPELSSKPLDISEKNIEISSDGLAARIDGQINLSGQTTTGVTVIAAGYSEGKPVGVRRMELNPKDTLVSLLKFELWLYSIGPPIEKVEIFAETE